MRRRRGQQLDQPRPRPLCVRAGNVTTHGLKLLTELAVNLLPSLGEIGHVGLALPLEVRLIGAALVDAVLEVPLEARLKILMGKLLQQHGRQADRRVGHRTEIIAFVDHRQERQVGFGGGLVEPILAVRPNPVAQDVRQMTVQHQAHRTYRHICSSGILVVRTKRR